MSNVFWKPKLDVLILTVSLKRGILFTKLLLYHPTGLEAKSGAVANREETPKQKPYWV